MTFSAEDLSPDQRAYWDEAVEASATAMPKPYYEDSAVTIYHADCREILPLLPKVDLVLTDPPYGIGGTDKWTERRPSPWAKDASPMEGDDKPFDPSSIMALSRPSIIWGANHFCTGLPPSPSWLVWDKRRGGSITTGWNAPDFELAWSNLTVGARIYSHLWEGYKRDSEIGEHYHPTQKPRALMRWCLELVPDADLILDPFMGSGTTLRAAKDLGRKAIGIEIEERYCEIAAKRMQQAVLPLGLDDVEKRQTILDAPMLGGMAGITDGNEIGSEMGGIEVGEHSHGE